MMRDREGRPLTPGDVMPSGMCQPPVNAMALIERLSPEAAQRILRIVAVWAPEVLEKGLQRVSEEREILAIFERERAEAGDAGKLAEIRAIFAAFDWERDDRQYALEQIEMIVGGDER